MNLRIVSYHPFCCCCCFSVIVFGGVVIGVAVGTQPLWPTMFTLLFIMIVSVS